MDRAAKDLAICELPSARGCTYVVPAEHFALALTVGQGFGEEAEIATAVKHLGVTEAEVERLIDGVLRALQNGALDPKAIRTSLGDQVRGLGDEGKKRGVTTTLPLALGRLQAQGRIRRVPVNGRLDQQRFAYAAWNPSPLEGLSLSKEEALLQLADLYFGWIGPATVSEFQVFAGLGVRAAKEIVQQLALQPAEPGSQMLLRTDDVDTFSSFQPPTQPHYVLVGSIDSIMHLRRETASLIDPDDLDHPALRASAQSPGNSLLEVVDHVILDRGRMVGLWQFDPEGQKIVWQSFIAADDALRRAVAETERWICEELQDARSFSLDSPASRREKLDRLRAASG